MPEAVKNKPKQVSITAENLRFICGLNGMMVTEVAKRLGCTSPYLYQVVRSPSEYPGPYGRLSALLPRREL
jgi:hypothetical protein